MVGAQDDGPVVFDDQHRVAAAREIAQQREQPFVVLRMEPDGRLVEHVEGRGQAGAERRREVNTLGLAARERARLTVERQVVQADPVQHREAFAHLVEEVAADGQGARVGTQRGEPGRKVLDREGEELGQRAPGESDRQRLGVQPAAEAIGAGVVGAVTRQQHAHVDAIGAALEPAEERLEVGEAPLSAPEPLAIFGRELAVRTVERHVASAGGAQEPLVELLVGRSVPRRDRPVGETLARIRNHPFRIDPDHPAEALAGRAGAEGRVEREQGRRRRAQGEAADRAGEIAAVSSARPAPPPPRPRAHPASRHPRRWRRCAPRRRPTPGSARAPESGDRAPRASPRRRRSAESRRLRGGARNPGRRARPARGRPPPAGGRPWRQGESAPRPLPQPAPRPPRRRYSGARRHGPRGRSPRPGSRTAAAAHRGPR